jgi:hypothetical protein
VPNRFGRAAGAPRDFNPQGLLPEGLLPVSRPDGSFESEMANATNRLANTFGGMADEAAKAEGKAAGTIAGLDPHYRPDGSLTIRGQAFNDAATKTYENNLDAMLRNDMQATFEINKNDPAALKKAIDSLYQRYTGPDGHVFDSIRGEFNAQFARLRLPYENRALSNYEEGVHASSRASVIENTTATETNAARMAAADPNNPLTAKNIEIELQRHSKLIDDAVANDDITADAAAKLKIKTRDSVLSSAALAQAAALKTPEAIAAYRENARKKFAAGEFKGLTADGYACRPSKGPSARRTIPRSRSSARTSMIMSIARPAAWRHRRMSGRATPRARRHGRRKANRRSRSPRTRSRSPPS